jgi:hypothetical protein
MVFFCINIGLVFVGAIIVNFTILKLQCSEETDLRQCSIGVYSSIRSIIHNLSEGVRGGSFSCADNSYY